MDGQGFFCLRREMEGSEEEMAFDQTLWVGDEMDVFVTTAYAATTRYFFLTQCILLQAGNLIRE